MMIKTVNYRNAFIAAAGLHLVLVFLLTMEHHSDQFVLKSGQQSHMAQTSLAMDTQQPQPEAIQAVSVDSQAVEQTLNRLKNERAQKQQAELNHQRAMEEQLRTAQQQRLKEQQNLVRLKKEAAQLAIAQQKKLAAEEKHLKELAHQKVQQEQHLAELQKQQQQMKQQQAIEQQRLAAVQKQKMNEAASAAATAAAAEKARAAAQQAQAAAAKQAAAAQQSAQMSGEVNKYKALIIQAISQHWILPEHVNSQVFSQFRIRLAPNGAVLSVNLIKSSGDPILDRSAQAAINKASPLPVPSDPATFNLFRDISLTVRPESARG